MRRAALAAAAALLAGSLATARASSAPELLTDAPGVRTFLLRVEASASPRAVEVADPAARLRLPGPDGWSGPLTPSAGGPGRAVFDLSASPPVTMLRIDLPPGPGAPAMRVETAPAAALVQLPALTEEVTRPQPIDRLPRFWRSWPIRAPAAEAGAAVRLELPPSIFDLPGIGPANVRPLSGKSVLPFALVPAGALAPFVAEAPRRAGAVADAAAGAAAGADAWGYELPRFAPQLRQLELIAPLGSDVAATVAIELLVVERPGARPAVREVASAPWNCAAGDAEPCVLLLPLAPPPGATSVRATLAGRRPLTFAARYWAPVQALLFAWPAEGAQEDVRLVAGFDPVPADAPQVRSVREQLSFRPARAAAIEPTATTVEEMRLRAWSPWVVGGAALVFGAVLLSVLARSIARRGTAGRA